MSKHYTNNYLSLINKAYFNNHLIHVTTITWICRLNKDHIDLLFFHNNFNIDNVTIKNISTSKEKGFSNQITIEFVNFSKKSIKLFKNGKVQITGLSSYYECVEVSNLLVEWLSKVFGDIYHILPDSKKIALINIHVNTFASLKLMNIYQLLQNDENITICSYNPDNYPAINAKFSSGTSMFIFHTGNLIMSNSSLDILSHDYSLIYHYFTSFSRNNNNTTLVCKNSISQLVNGYDIKDLLSCVTILNNTI